MRARLLSLVGGLADVARRGVVGDLVRRIPGLVGLYRAGYRLLRPHGIVAARSPGGVIYVRAEDQEVARDILLYGAYEPTETELFRHALAPGMTVIDIGANIGYYTLLAAKQVGETGRVHAFEPDPRNHELLARSIAANPYKTIELHRQAVSNRAGKATLFFAPASWGSPSLGKVNVNAGARSVEVDTVTLDAFCAAHGAPDLIKVDVQGAEGLVLEGAAQTLASARPTLFLEFWPQGLSNLGANPKALLEQLVGIGYRFTLVESHGRVQREAAVSEVMSACERQAQQGIDHVDLVCRARGTLSS